MFTETKNQEMMPSATVCINTVYLQKLSAHKFKIFFTFIEKSKFRKYYYYYYFF